MPANEGTGAEFLEWLIGNGKNIFWNRKIGNGRRTLISANLGLVTAAAMRRNGKH